MYLHSVILSMLTPQMLSVIQLLCVLIQKACAEQIPCYQQGKTQQVQPHQLVLTLALIHQRTYLFNLKSTMEFQ